MARAFCDRIQESDASGDTISVALACLYYGTDVPETIRQPVNFTVLGTDTPAQMAQKATDAIVTKAAQLGLSVARNATAFVAVTRGG